MNVDSFRKVWSLERHSLQIDGRNPDSELKMLPESLRVANALFALNTDSGNLEMADLFFAIDGFFEDYDTYSLSRARLNYISC